MGYIYCLMFEQVTQWAENSESIKQAKIGNRGYPFWKEAVKFILLIILLEFMVNFIISFPFVLTDANSNISIIIQLFSTLIFIVIYLLFILKIEKRSLRSVGFSKDNILSSYGKGFLFGFLMLSAVIIIGLLLGIYKFESFSLNDLYLLIPFLLGFMIQSMKEEIYARGWIMISIARKNSIFLAIVFSSLAFVVIHIFNNGVSLLALVNIFLMGVVLSLLFLRYDNVWICGAFHASWNFMLSYFYGLNVSGMNNASLFSITQTHYSLLGGNAFGPESGLITTIIALIVIMLILYYKNPINTDK